MVIGTLASNAAWKVAAGMENIEPGTGGGTVSGSFLGGNWNMVESDSDSLIVTEDMMFSAQGP
jgi:hypothetical protein